jgi:hypothetical protein
MLSVAASGILDGNKIHGTRNGVSLHLERSGSEPTGYAERRLKNTAAGVNAIIRGSEEDAEEPNNDAQRQHGLGEGKRSGTSERQ